MNCRSRVRPLAEALFAACLLLAALWLPSPAGAEEDSFATEQYGRAIFTYEFEVGKGVTSGGDGLAPVFNHRSCVGCHFQGGVGGGGPLDVNVHMLAARRSEPRQVPPQSNQMCATAVRQDPRQELITLHPSFVVNRFQIIPNILLHRFGADERYVDFRTGLGGPNVPLEPSAADRGELARRLNELPVATVKRTDAIHVQRVQRNTPALFGAGLIDQIPDAALQVEASFQEVTGVVSGRVPPV
jgi:hypothetical protein